MGVFSSKPQNDLIERSPAVKQNKPKPSADELLNTKGTEGLAEYLAANPQSPTRIQVWPVKFIC